MISLMQLALKQTKSGTANDVGDAKDGDHMCSWQGHRWHNIQFVSLPPSYLATKDLTREELRIHTGRFVTAHLHETT